MGPAAAMSMVWVGVTTVFVMFAEWMGTAVPFEYTRRPISQADPRMP
jgi:hypothetical protein